jgi:fatty acid desaturase
MPQEIEYNKKLLESLVDRATDYGKTSFELVKLKAVDKTSDVVSSVIPHAIVIVLFASFMLFFNLGLALWFGEILGKLFYGFFLVAAFYVTVGTAVHLFMHKSLKKLIRNYVIQQLLK